MSLESRLDKAEFDLASQKVTIDTLRVDNEFLKEELSKLATLVGGLFSGAGVDMGNV